MKLKINKNNREIVENPNEFLLADIKKILKKSSSLEKLHRDELDEIITLLALILCSDDRGQVMVGSEEELSDFINENFSYLKNCAVNILIKIFGN